MDTNENAKKSRLDTKCIALIGLMAAVTCILGPLSIPLPISPVPISLTNFAIYLAIYVLGTRRGTLSYLIYLLIGFVGVPVFAAFTAGPQKLLGPTGGYLIGFIPMALICGIFIDKCVLNGITEVRIIHGKGTGVLRSVVTEELRHHPNIDEFRLGKYGEGEDGVTIAKLK